MDSVDVVEDFYGVYLLYNISVKYKGRTYIGFTVDPNRRISQHNKGFRSGGARKTSCKGPWEMVLIIHGFPNEISALRFEWAWQNPKKSRRLKHLPHKTSKESSYDFALRILNAMLLNGPWCRLPLSIRWLKDSYVRDFPITSQPPLHMPIVHGRIAIQKLTKPSEVEKDEDVKFCYHCFNEVLFEDAMCCVNPKCKIICHLICFSTFFSSSTGHLLPLEGKCPSCKIQILWGDLVRKKRGCYRNLEEIDGSVDTSEFEDIIDDVLN